jgi:hypothetical protein
VLVEAFLKLLYLIFLGDYGTLNVSLILTLIQTSIVDFTEVAVHYPGPFPAGTSFTVSSCGRFLMVANGCLVYLYELNRSHNVAEVGSMTIPGALRPVTSIICPRRVLACSMDTSSNRYAIAILLDGRMGLVCEINAHVVSLTSSATGRGMPNGKSVNVPGPDATSETGVRGTSFLDRVSLRTSASASNSSHQVSRKYHDSLNLHPTTANPLQQTKELPFVFPGIATAGASFAPVNQSDWQDAFRDDMPEHIRTAGLSSRHGSLPPARADGPQSQMEDYFVSTLDRLLNSMPIENGPRSLYRNLCSDDDPPRSVAICPQRRCVAFGCSSGIELHWVDALTGQDLNRWFPLTAPSDSLFFLPPRRSIDSAKKLRLISSAAKPGERPAIAERPFGTRAKSSPFWERLPVGLGNFDSISDADLNQGFLTRLRGDAGRSSLTGRMDCSDHYRAVPLSDGYHILFTDPSTGLLWLGSDAPVGGPTKLLRKIWFQGPKGEGTPIAYSAGADLSCGVRIVAAFGNGTEQAIWLFSVPSDVFATNQGGQSPLSASSYLRSKSGQENPTSEWIDWWPDDGLQEWLNHARDPVAGILPRSVWPVKIRGQQIGSCCGLVDLTIDSGPDMTIWAFNKHGVATVWKIDLGRNEKVNRRCVMRDGTVRDIDGEGDVEMSDAPSPSPDILQPPMPLIQESFDGSAPFPPIMQANLVQYNSEGDLLMDELPHSQRFHDNEPEPEEITPRTTKVYLRFGTTKRDGLGGFIEDQLIW